jgi:hypothetical protein
MHKNIDIKVRWKTKIENTKRKNKKFVKIYNKMTQNNKIIYKINKVKIQISNHNNRNNYNYKCKCKSSKINLFNNINSSRYIHLIKFIKIDKVF